MSAVSVVKVGLGAAGAAAIVALVAACASSSSSGTPAGGSTSSSAQSPPAVSASASGLKTRSTSIGTVLVDGSGRTVYELVGDSPGKSTCPSACLAIWPAVKAHGSQVVVNGHPAFTYVGDKSAGQTNGQNLTDQWGRWLALDASGNPIGASAGPSSKTPASQSSSKSAPGGGGPAF